jgi:hypothetical protein
MEFVVRLVRSACGLVFGGGADEVVLRHVGSGLVLTDGSPDRTPVRFSSASEAGSFSQRFLDECRGWEAVAALEADQQAA